MTDLNRHMDRRAAETATPTPAQAEAGNYRKGRLVAHGLPIAIETPRGALRKGIGRDGKPWSVRMPVHYGEISRTEGSDGDPVDVFLGPHLRSPNVFVLDQMDADTGRFDEHKVWMGFATVGQVRAAYRKCFSDGKADRRLGTITEMSADQFRHWLENSDTTKPMHRASGGRVGFAEGGVPTFDQRFAGQPYDSFEDERPAPRPDAGDEEARANLAAIQAKPQQPESPGFLASVGNAAKSFADYDRQFTENVLNLPEHLRGPAAQRFYDRLFGANGAEREQTWPEKMVRSGATLPGDVASGQEPMWGEDGHTAQNVIERAQDTAGMAMGSSFGANPAEASLRSGAGRRASTLPMDEASRMQRAAEQGFEGPWYHGGARMDRFTENEKIDPRRATSGPMPFMTDNPELASSYAMGKKADTSMRDDMATSDYFTVSPKQLGVSGRSPLTVEQSWNYLPAETKADILAKAKRVGHEIPDEASGPFKLHDEDATLSSSTYDRYLQSNRGNPLAALRELWVDSGHLFDNPDQLTEIYRLAGYPHRISETNAPWTEARGVAPLRVRMTNPLPTDNMTLMTETVLPRLEEMLKRDRTRAQEFGADQWDKRGITTRDWIQQAKEDYAKGENSFVWTQIPDKITDALRTMGYDGILDNGGKMGGEHHRVAVPFGPEQVRSQFAKFDPKNVGKSGLLLSDSGQPGAAVSALHHAKPFYSAVERAVEGISQPRMTGDAWLGTLRNKAGVKPEEMEWTGLQSFLESKKGQPVTKQEIADHLAANQVELKEVSKGGGATNEQAFELAKEHGWKSWEDIDTATQQKYLRRAQQELGDADPTKYHKYQLPGGENYREMLLTLPEAKAGKPPERYIVQGQGPYVPLIDTVTGREVRAGMWGDMRDHAARMNAEAAGQPTPYRSSHWDENNILAHVRMNDRTIDGKRSLHLEEIQSDWHQQGRDKGYDSAAGWSATPTKFAPGIKGYSVTDANGRHIADVRAPSADEAIASARQTHGKQGTVPDAPFKKTWHELALKRMLREAAEKGYDRISWTPGEAQAARYDLSRQIDALHYEKNPNGTFSLYTTEKGGGVRGAAQPLQSNVPVEKLPDYIGKEVAKKIADDEGKPGINGLKTIAGLDLKVGGEGMRGFYDQIIPKALEKLTKEHGVKAQKGEIPDAKNVNNFSAYESRGGRHLRDFADSDEAHRWLAANGYPDGRVQIATKKAAEPVWYIDLPQSLKDQALQRGFSMFEDSGMAGAGFAGTAHSRLNDPAYKIRAMENRGRGISTGKSAKGWGKRKRDEPKRGSFQRAAEEAIAGFRHDSQMARQDFRDAANPRMTPEDWDFMRSQQFRKNGGRVGYAGGGAPDDDFAVPADDFAVPEGEKPAAPDQGAGHAAWRGAQQGLTFNFLDELEAIAGVGKNRENEPEPLTPLVRGAYRYWTGQPGAEDQYNEHLKRIRGEDKAAQEQHPIAYGAGEVAGMLPGVAAMPGAGAAARAASMGPRMLRGAQVGAEAGALSGAGDGEDAADRVIGAGVGAGAGAATGAAAPVVGKVAGMVYDRAVRPAVQTARGWMNPEQEAARRLATALRADQQQIAAGKAQGMSAQEWGAAKAAGEPVTLADLGAGNTQSLLRSAANTSPEGRALLEKVINDRFEQQTTRVADDVRGLVGGGANAGKTADQLVAEYDVARGPAYKAAFNHPNAQVLWDADFEQMATAPAVQQAIKMASVNARDEAAKLGIRAPKNPFTFNPDGSVGLTVPNLKPNLQFWDVVKKNLDAGDRQSQQWAKILRNKLDSYGTGYDNARGIAATFFGERDALAAGRSKVVKSMDPNQLKGVMQKMNPQERELFREGYASDWADRIIGNMKDSRDITKAMFNSPNERQRAMIVFGPAGMAKMQARMSLETIMDGARRAMGNSTTARQLIEAGLAGGALSGYESGFDPTKMAMGALVGAGARAGVHRLPGAEQVATGAKHLIGKVDAKTAKRVAELLTADDPAKLQQGLRLAASNQRIADGLRRVADRLALSGAFQGTSANLPAPRLHINTAGWGSGSAPANAQGEQQ